MLRNSALYEEIEIAVEDRFRERINNATATATMLARYTSMVEEPDDEDFQLFALVADGLADMLTFAIDTFENNVIREEE